MFSKREKPIMVNETTTFIQGQAIISTRKRRVARRKIAKCLATIFPQAWNSRPAALTLVPLSSGSAVGLKNSGLPCTGKHLSLPEAHFLLLSQTSDRSSCYSFQKRRLKDV